MDAARCSLRQRHIAEGGLPVGVQVIARFGEDAKALAAARFVEGALRR